jgi:4-amino-4-deoxy-L-arabinose transferase-like glycosyltransferase
MSNDTNLLPPEPRLDEPTVLDLFKSITKDRASFSKFMRSLFDSGQRAEFERSVAERAYLLAQPEPRPVEAGPRFLPWRSTVGIILAVLAQSLLEPPDRNAVMGIAFYFFAIGLVIWAFLKNEWRFPELRADQPGVDPMSVRFIPLILAAVFAPIAFWFFKDNLFTPTNLILWALALCFFFWAFWEKRGAGDSVWKRIGAFFRRDAWQINLTRGGLLWFAVWIAVFGLVIYFRLDNIDGIPAEPFSDHAEKILDVYEITQGQTHVFFERNTGREAIQMYWTLLVSWIFGTGLSFLSLKLGTALLGLLTLPYVYLLGKEFGGARVGMLAMFLFGIAYWPNVISRIGLRFPLYPLFVAPAMFYLLRGLRTRTRNDFLLCGLFIGLGLHGYSPFRMMPIVVLAAFALFLLYEKTRPARLQAVWWLALVGLTAFLIFLPLFRFSVERPDLVSYRALTRLGQIEQTWSAPPLQIFFSNFGKALLMFNWDDGVIWVNSIPYRPALDVVSAALFLTGVVLLSARFIRRRDWRDLFLLISIPLLLMPSILSLAYPGENPALNRSSGAAVPVFLVAALALDGLLTGLSGPAEGRGRLRPWLVAGLAAALLAFSVNQNHDLVFRQFGDEYRAGTWNTSEMGMVISDFRERNGQTDTLWIVPYPYWVDTRLPGVWAGIPNRDFAMFPENLATTLEAPYPKLFIFNREDLQTEELLGDLYPDGVLSRYTSAWDPNKDFMLYFVEK